jgi:hypothetical protein
VLALFALAVQLAVSFGHIHVDGVVGETTPTVVVGGNASTSPFSPAQHPADEANDYCAICAVIHLAATSFLPQSPQLAVPFVAETVEHSNLVAFFFVAPQRTPFQSRAPPLA